MSRIDRRRSSVALAGVVAIAGSGFAQSFTDVTDAAGLGGPFVATPSAHIMHVMTSGIAVADFDEDGWQDIFWHGGNGQPCRLFRNQQDGTFIDVAPGSGLDVMVPGSMPMWFDFDGDADLDLFLLTYEDQVDGPMVSGPNGPLGPLPPAPMGKSVSGTTLQEYRNALFRARGDGTFTEVAEQAGALHTGRHGLAAGDLDGDGRPDLVGTSQQNDHNRMLLNQGDGTFRDRTPALVVDTFSRGFSPHIVDMDGDGDQDVVWAGDFETSKHWRNDGALDFIDVTGHLGVGVCGMGCSVGDYDNDGDPDLFISSIYYDGAVPLPDATWCDSGNRLFANEGDGTLIDVTDAAGVRDGGWGWGSDFGDLDNDGDLDLVHTNGWYVGPEYPFGTDTNKVFLNSGAGVFTESAQLFGVDDGDQGRGLVIFDADNDGALDILISNHDVGLTLYRNDPATVSGHWLSVELRDASAFNSRALGSKIVLENEALPTQTRWVECGSNYVSQSPLVAHFGLGAESEATLTVTWPDGEIQRVGVVQADQRLVIVR